MYQKYSTFFSLAYKKWWQAVNLAVFFGLLLSISYYYDLHNHLNLDYLRAVIEKSGLFGLFLFTLLFVAGNLVQIPGLLFLLAAVLTLGQLYCGMVTYFAAIISCTSLFLLVRQIGGQPLADVERPMIKKWLDRIHMHPLLSVFILRSLFQTQPILSYSLALSKVDFKTHLLGTVVALPLPIFLYCWFFESLIELFALAVFASSVLSFAPTHNTVYNHPPLAAGSLIDNGYKSVDNGFYT